MIGTAGRRAWLHVISFFAFLPDVRRVLSTTHALESDHARLRTVIKTRGHFPNDDAASTLVSCASVQQKAAARALAGSLVSCQPEMNS